MRSAVPGRTKTGNQPVTFRDKENHTMSENNTNTAVETDVEETEVAEPKTTLVDGSVKDVTERVGNDPKKATRAYKLEVAGKARSSLLDTLKHVIVDGMSLPAWANKGQVGPSGARFQMANSTLALLESTEAYNEDVADIIAAGTHRNTGVRLDNNAATLTKLSKVLWTAADELFEQSIADFKTLLRSSRIASSQADAAANYTPPAEPEAVETEDEAIEAEADDVADTVTA